MVGQLEILMVQQMPTNADDIYWMLANCYTVTEVSCVFQWTGKISRKIYTATCFFLLYACMHEQYSYCLPQVVGPTP